MNNILSENFINLEEIAIENKEGYGRALPFPHIEFDNFFNEVFLSQVLNEFPDLSKANQIKYDNPREKKFAGKGEALFDDTTLNLMHFLNSEPFLKFLQILTGIEEPIIGDPYFVGGGQHEIKKGGLLKIHADFNKHPTLGLDRRLNVLIYLNKDWNDSYGGFFELWDKDMSKCVTRVSPLFNKLVVFSTTADSYHGHPDPLNCPENRSRKSLALYYYTNGRPKAEIDIARKLHGTLFQKRKDNLDDQRALAQRDFKEVIIDFIPPVLLNFLRRFK